MHMFLQQEYMPPNKSSLVTCVLWMLAAHMPFSPQKGLLHLHSVVFGGRISGHGTLKTECVRQETACISNPNILFLLLTVLWEFVLLLPEKERNVKKKLKKRRMPTTPNEILLCRISSSFWSM